MNEQWIDVMAVLLRCGGSRVLDMSRKKNWHKNHGCKKNGISGVTVSVTPSNWIGGEILLSAAGTRQLCYCCG